MRPTTHINSLHQDLPFETALDLRMAAITFPLTRCYSFSASRWPNTADPYLRHLPHSMTNILRPTPSTPPTQVAILLTSWPFASERAAKHRRTPLPTHSLPLISIDHDWQQPLCAVVGVFGDRHQWSYWACLPTSASVCP